MTNAKQKALISDILSQANKINEEHEAFVTQFVTRANEELYVLLANMMRVCEDIWQSDCEDYLHKQMRKELQQKWGIKTQRNTKTTSLVVRYIIRGNRQLVHNYAKVIEIAKTEGIKSDGLAQYIKDKGSIDAVRKKVVDVEDKKQQLKNINDANKRLVELLRSSKNIGTILLNNSENRYQAKCSDVKFSLTLSVSAGNEERAVATIYPSSTILEQCLSLYQLTCKIAALDSGKGDFYAACKEHGMNVDVVHRWMKDNCIASAEDAVEMARAIEIDGYEYKRSVGKIKIAA